MQISVIIYFERFFMITIFQEKNKKQKIIWETKTTFIIDFKNKSKQIGPYNTFTLGRVKDFQNY